MCVCVCEWESVKVRKRKNKTFEGGSGFASFHGPVVPIRFFNQSINQSENKKHPSCCIKSSPPYPNRGVVELYSSFPLSLFLFLSPSLSQGTIVAPMSSIPCPGMPSLDNSSSVSMPIPLSSRSVSCDSRCPTLVRWKARFPCA